MAAVRTAGRSRRKGGASGLQALLWRLPWLRSLLLLVPPMVWMVFVYLA